jgi:hypothetical protein
MQGAVQAPLRTSPVEQQPVAQNCSDTNAVHLIGLDMHAIIELGNDWSLICIKRVTNLFHSDFVAGSWATSPRLRTLP